MSPIVQAENLRFHYHPSRTIFHDVTFAVGPGEILTILGTNGAGKSTLLNCIAGLLKPVAGEIRLEGRRQADLSYRDVARIVGYVPQIHNPSYGYSVLEFTVMGRTPYIGAFSSPKPRDYEIARESIERMGVGHLADKPYTQISGGERQLATIARAIAQQAKLIMLDEPTAHLDFGNQMKTVQMIRRLADDGYAVILTTHVPDHPVYLGGHVALFEDGAVSFGPAEELITAERLTQLYGIPLKLIRSDEVARPICVAV
jgi:iron complex transport system ATP-binding protein